MQDDSPYRATLRTQRENIEFWSLPILETRAQRLAREASRRQLRTFIAGVASTLAAIAVLAVIF
jgi:hypothetical protein